MALSQSQVEFLAEQFSGDSILVQVAAGNVTQDDADRILVLNAGTPITEFEQMPDVISGFVSSKEAIITGNLDDTIQAQFDLLGGLEDTIEAVLLSVLDPIINLIQIIPNQINAGINSTVVSIAALVDGLESRILDPVLSSLSETVELVSRLDNVILDGLNASIAPIRAVSDSIFDQVQGFASALRDTIPELGSILGGALEAGTDKLVEGVGDAAKQVLSAFFGDIAGDVVERIDPLIQMFEDELSVAPELRKITAPGALPAAAVGGLIAGFALPMILSSVASTALSPFAEKMRQRMASLVRPALMGAADALQGVQKGFVSTELKDAILDRHGFPDDQQVSLFELVKIRPGTLDIIDYWRRELITDDDADTRLHDLGWDSDDRNLIRQAAFPPPGVQDLIRMAVREVFSPEIAEAFGQFDEIPEPYLMWAKRIGLSEEWARNYWAAHWVLPSVQQGFEMLHRGVINEEEIERLFVALDVMPFWRPQLKAISFRPFTRVDVRRMFALGVLDEAQVKRSYLDLGFDEEKAAAQTLFTVRWVESTRKVEKDRERDLTKGDIIGLFNDGLISSELAKTHLEDMGFNEAEADLLIRREEVQEMLRDRKADIKLVVDQAKIKVLTFQDAQDRLTMLDLTPSEMSKALLDVTRATTERVRLPTKADLDSWRSLELLSPSQYEQELDNLGYPAKYIALYSEEIQLEEADDLLAAEVREARRVEPRPVTKGQLDSLLRTEIIDVPSYSEGLNVLGFEESAINSFLEQITIQIEETRISDLARVERGELAGEKEKPLSRVTLGKLLLKGIITINSYQEGLRVLGFTPESIALLVRLIQVKIEALAEEE